MFGCETGAGWRGFLVYLEASSTSKITVMNSISSGYTLRLLSMFVALRAARSACAQVVVLDSFSQPAGGQIVSATASPPVYVNQSEANVAAPGVLGGYRDLFVVADGSPYPASGPGTPVSATATVNTGASGFTLTASPGGSAFGSINYYGWNPYPYTAIIDLSRFSAIRLENLVTTLTNIRINVLVTDSQGDTESIQSAYATPFPGNYLNLLMSQMKPQSENLHPVDLSHIAMLFFAISQYGGGETHIGSIDLIPVPEPATATVLVGAFLGLWAVGRFSNLEH